MKNACKKSRDFLSQSCRRFLFCKTACKALQNPENGFVARFFGFFKNHFAMLKQYFCNDIATLYPSPLKSLPKHKKAAIFSRFSHFNKSSKMHRFPAILCISTPKKRLCSAIFREIKLFKASEPLFSHSTWLITPSFAKRCWKTALSCCNIQSIRGWRATTTTHKSTCAPCRQICRRTVRCALWL